MQEEIINAVLAGRDTLALLPTGGGKSICFQVPALMSEGICIVVSPLIALMKDQVEQLKRRGIRAAAIFSGMSKREIDITLDNCVYGQIKFLYVSPERLQTSLFLARAEKMNINLLAIDEAHCISQWGYDFRPPYLEITKFREKIPFVPCIALTATATNEVKKDIQEKLNFPQPNIFQKSFARANLSYSVLYEENKELKLLRMLQRVPGTAVVYVRSRKRTKVIADYLKRNGISADYYHAGLSNELRSKKQDNWINNRTRVMVSTNAFGMGIDKADVRLVVHIDLPDNLEAYYQEAGRAGRDEKMAYAAVLYNRLDIEELKKRVAQTYPSIELIKKTYQAIANFFKMAVGSGFMASFDFDLDALIKTYQLDYIATYYSVKRLEEQGFIQLNEAFYAPSKVMFLVDKQQLYAFQIANASLDSFIKLLLRVYGGELFTSPKPISETQLAQLLKSDKQAVIKKLAFLHTSKIIQYAPQNDRPKLTFTAERYDIARLPFDKKLFEFRKKRDTDKVAAVIDYVEHPNRCRTLLLLAYFGEFSDENCGICDHCIQMKKNKTFHKEVPDYDKMVLELLKEKALALPELMQKMANHDEDMITTTIKEMVETGELQYNAQGLLEIGNS